MKYFFIKWINFSNDKRGSLVEFLMENKTYLAIGIPVLAALYAVFSTKCVSIGNLLTNA